MSTTTAAAVASVEGEKKRQMSRRARFVDHDAGDGQTYTEIKSPMDEYSNSATLTFGVAKSQGSRALQSQKTVNNLLSFSQAGSLNLEFDNKEQEAEEFRRAHARVKKQIDRLGRTTISPQSKFLSRWDLATASAMLWTAFVTPFQIGFLEPLESPASALSILNRLVDVVFIIDMILTFFIPYRESPHRGGMWTFDNKKIAVRYLSSWFVLDLTTSIPLDLIMVATASTESEGDGLGDASFLRLVRVFRVAKLARLLRASRIYARWIDHVGISFAVASLVKFLVMTCVLAHWLACLWGFTGQRVDFETPSWHDRLPDGIFSIGAGDAQYTHALDLYGICICACAASAAPALRQCLLF